jgi:prepilin-type N-terminal cleavage/methylation domain-containing protein
MLYNVLREIMRKNTKQGFTLIELMIVVAIIGILAAIAIPRFAQMLEKSREGATKGNLAGLRSAISIYYSEREGTYPDDLTASFTSYLYPIPPAKASPLGNTSTVTLAWLIPQAPGTGWAYEADPIKVFYGNIYPNTNATDTKGLSFTTY